MAVLSAPFRLVVVLGSLRQLFGLSHFFRQQLQQSLSFSVVGLGLQALLKVLDVLSVDEEVSPHGPSPQLRMALR